MFQDFTPQEAADIFKFNFEDAMDDFWDFHSIVEGLMVVYCYAFNRPLEKFSEKKYTKEEADALVGDLIKKEIRIPRIWDDIDLSALYSLLVDINFDTEASDLFDVLKPRFENVFESIENRGVKIASA